MNAHAAVAGVAGVAGGVLSQDGASDDTGLRILALVFLGLVLAGATVGGGLAYSGRWRSWYPDRYKMKFMPLAVPWFTAAVFFMGVLVGLDALFDPIPIALGAAGLVLAMLCLLVAGVYAIYPPRRILPRWVRYLEGDPSVSDPDRRPGT
ncbi:hypothetical protein E1264_27310 [Actinomadura sp. KC216]|uniref:hypothetical protein n=1 Tax=Actinomadura sp. KC216 TaxID=2530370 RepID=UPI0010455339|nr:hypothetical protein [Actinomadura sp. KC216]TDB83734.1 hypothetical protein E1264_27310 [Actinomadura sp. KC216]